MAVLYPEMPEKYNLVIRGVEEGEMLASVSSMGVYRRFRLPAHAAPPAKKKRKKKHK